MSYGHGSALAAVVPLTIERLCSRCGKPYPVLRRYGERHVLCPRCWAALKRDSKARDDLARWVLEYMRSQEGESQ